MPKSGPKTLGNCLPGDVLQQYVSRDEARRVWQQAWSSSVDPELVNFAEAVRFERGVLTLHCRSAARASRLRTQKMRLMALLLQHPALQGLKQIEIQVRPQAVEEEVEPYHARQAQPVQRQIPAATRSMILGIADAVSDPELSAALKRLADDKQ